MSKIVLIALSLAALSLASSLDKPINPEKLDYEDIKVIIGSFMNTYTNSQYNLTNCFPESMQNKLNQFIAASIGYLAFLDFTKVLDCYEQFLFNLATECGVCGLNQVQKSLLNGVDDKSLFWFEINLAYHSKEVMGLFEIFAKEIENKKYTDAGSTLGQITAILIPYEQPALSSSFIFDASAYQSWWNGAIYTLSLNPKNYGRCAYFLGNFSIESTNTAIDIENLVLGHMSVFNTIFGDLASTLTFYKKNYTGVCMFETLWENIAELASSTGASELAARYAARAMVINSAIMNIKNCDTSFYACGQGVATLIKYLLNWSIN
ncbi:hypothetical protein SteCoe_14366 [Stentor coeruleus]|uniref:Uncharacterized protein n=1 Tax=Stentor coeruleus TaxID=5963 RepID=A0A1R2C679_9CILI|nr:hypothetical protein SteCoe_14366 [Stentor coeruleus]